MSVIDEVAAERARQDAKWGEQNHNPFVWLTIIGEELGESQKAAFDMEYGDGPRGGYREELVQTAAVAVAAIESFDRQGDV